MSQEFHSGELTVQQRAGVRAMAERVGGSIHAEIPPVAAEFLRHRPFVVLATTDTQGRPWASVVAGPPGFARAVDARSARIDAPLRAGDAFAEGASSSPFVGLLAIDLQTQRRLRLNGRLQRTEDDALLIRADQMYANCQKYIQRRIEVADAPRAAGVPSIRRSAELDAPQRAWIEGADTFFIATANPGEGADASHRGGMPGFVRVDGDRLVWPDYPGNAMFNTLGNIAVHPWAGLAFPDFATGAVLQVVGRATIDWDASRAAAIAGAERLVELRVEAVVESTGVLARPWRFLEYSRFNPAVG